LAEIVDARIASGRNASESEVIREALELLAEQDAPLEDPELEAWLRGQVVPAYEKWKSGGEKGLSADEVRASLAHRRSERRSDAAE
jgi:Arc/MetJ-type ribon-helix-helix transcriptional regulator